MDPSSRASVALLSDDEIPASFEVLSKAFGHDAPFVDIYFPAHDTPTGQAQGAKRLVAWKQSGGASTFIKAVVGDGRGGPERIVGLAIWTHMKEPPPAELEKAENVEEVWPDKNDRGFMTRLWKEYVIPRTEAVVNSEGKGVYVLELLAVHPEYQGRGGGTALVEWGTSAADKQGLVAVVEGTPVGRRVYEKCGFSSKIEEMRFDVGNEFSERTKPKLVFMTRDPQPQV
ncbi:hypothetical protein F5Y15DRAFT_398179 [Xylariaceae sp. FL0016]|nr:hypothetical protein F5Y15DRAFT_398179 [Xylariaceae sp. FL0016]